jgi:hypothetical protein
MTGELCLWRRDGDGPGREGTATGASPNSTSTSVEVDAGGTPALRQEKGLSAVEDRHTDNISATHPSTGWSNCSRGLSSSFLLPPCFGLDAG